MLKLEFLSLFFSTSDYGIIRFHVGDGAGEEEITFYWSPEPLRFGDQVQFQVACRCYDELCYATNIKVVQWAKDFRFQVCVCVCVCVEFTVL